MFHIFPSKKCTLPNNSQCDFFLLLLLQTYHKMRSKTFLWLLLNQHICRSWSFCTYLEMLEVSRCKRTTRKFQLTHYIFHVLNILWMCHIFRIFLLVLLFPVTLLSPSVVMIVIKVNLKISSCVIYCKNNKIHHHLLIYFGMYGFVQCYTVVVVYSS